MSIFELAYQYFLCDNLYELKLGGDSLFSIANFQLNKSRTSRKKVSAVTSPHTLLPTPPRLLHLAALSARA
ncbi:MAG: hypothetical protein DSM106950_08625 [Stigonema ocellatum SAG 48.90 = DSM 106950]|nr:hypothetical protein [Stigonema ocellatum SAG 48.90 = DSM 106950]